MRRPPRSHRRPAAGDGTDRRRGLAGTVTLASLFVSGLLALSYPGFVGGVAVGAWVVAAALRLRPEVPARPSQSPPRRAHGRGSRSH